MADVQIPPEDNDDDVFCTITDSSGENKDWSAPFNPMAQTPSKNRNRSLLYIWIQNIPVRISQSRTMGKCKGRT